MQAATQSIALSEWRVRIRYGNGKVVAGRYVGAQDGHVYVGDPNTGEITDVREVDIENIDIRPPVRT